MFSNRRLAIHLNNLGFLRQILGDHAGAEEAYAESVEYRRRVWGSESQRTAVGLYNLGGARIALGRYDEARDVLLETLRFHESQGPPVDEATVYNQLARLELAQGNVGAARSMLTSAREILEGLEDPGDRWPAETLGLQGRVLMEEGALEEAEELLLDAHATLVDAHGPAQTSTREMARNLSELYERMDRPAEARQYRDLASPPGSPELLAQGT